MSLRELLLLKWGSFVWNLFGLKPGLPIEDYRKLSIVQNKRFKQANHCKPTMYELLKGLRQFHDRMYENLRKQSRIGSRGIILKSVSYTHLTLPTILLV